VTPLAYSLKSYSNCKKINQRKDVQFKELPATQGSRCKE